MPAGTEVKYRVYSCDIYNNWAVSDIYTYTPSATTTTETTKIETTPSTPTGLNQAIIAIAAAVIIIASIVVLKKREIGTQR